MGVGETPIAIALVTNRIEAEPSGVDGETALNLVTPMGGQSCIDG